MVDRTALDIRKIAECRWRLEFPYNSDFIEWLKAFVHHTHRSYNPQAKVWEVELVDALLPTLEQKGLSYFNVVTRIFRRGNELVYRDAGSGHESVIGSLF